MSWQIPEFTQSFQGIRLQQGYDAKFEAVVVGSPAPEVSWTRHGAPLTSSEKYELNFDPRTGKVSLTIRQIGPGDEGEYGCTAKNPYGEVTARLGVNPDPKSIKSHNAAFNPHSARAQLHAQRIKT